MISKQKTNKKKNTDWFEEIKTLLRKTPHKVKDNKPFEIIWSISDKGLMTKIYR